MTVSPLLLDTCAILWLFGGSQMSDTSRQAIAEATDQSRLYMSPISAWEIGMLVSKGRIALSLPVEKWIDRAFDHPGVQIADLTTHILVASSFLPGALRGDPADRIVVATARDLGLKIVTRDKLLLTYAEQGHVQALAC